MKTSIVMSIEPGADGVRCGECGVAVGVEGHGFCKWSASRDGSKRNGFRAFRGKHGYRAFRGPLCLAAESRHRRMVDALRDAAKSLETLSFAGGRNSALDGDLINIRGYANSRAVAARAILREEEG